MKKEELKSLLCSFRSMQAQLRYLGSEYGVHKTAFEEKEKTFRMIESALTVLDERERFIIENHLLNHETWGETSKKLLSHFGAEYFRSDRTLKRIQNRALEKMLTFIEDVSMF